MTSASVTMMIVTLGFYLIGFVLLLNKAFNSKKNE